MSDVGEGEAVSKTPATRPGEWAVYGVLLLLAIYAYTAAGDFAPEGARWPRSLALVLGLSIVVERAVAIRAARRGGGGTETVDAPEDVTEASAKLALVVAGFFFLYVLGAYGVGFLLATPIFTVAFMLWRGFGRRPVLMVAVPLGLTATIYVLFGRVISTPLTRGAWLQYDLPGWL